MSSVSQILVREFFEMHGFLVRQQKKSTAPSRRDEEEADFLVFNPQPVTAPDELPFILTAEGVSRLGRALIAVKGWHSETFSPSFLARVPEVLRVSDPEILQQASRFFGADHTIKKVLVAPALPQTTELRNQTVEVLKSKGIDHVLLFSTILASLIQETEAHRSYEKSDSLQVIRLLKNYGFVKSPQLELFIPSRKRKK